MKKANSKHYKNLCDVQIRFRVYDSIRFERPRLIISFNFCNFFFAKISSII